MDSGLRPVCPGYLPKERPPIRRVVISNVHPHISKLKIMELLSKLPVKVKPLQIDMKIYNPLGHFKIRCAIVHVVTQREANCIVCEMNETMLHGYTIHAKSIEELAKETKALIRLQHKITYHKRLQGITECRRSTHDPITGEIILC